MILYKAPEADGKLQLLNTALAIREYWAAVEMMGKEKTPANITRMARYFRAKPSAPKIMIIVPIATRSDLVAHALACLLKIPTDQISFTDFLELRSNADHNSKLINIVAGTYEGFRGKPDMYGGVTVDLSNLHSSLRYWSPPLEFTPDGAQSGVELEATTQPVVQQLSYVRDCGNFPAHIVYNPNLFNSWEMHFTRLRPSMVKRVQPSPYMYTHEIAVDELAQALSDCKILYGTVHFTNETGTAAVSYREIKSSDRRSRGVRFFLDRFTNNAIAVIHTEIRAGLMRVTKAYISHEIMDEHVKITQCRIRTGFTVEQEHQWTKAMDSAQTTIKMISDSFKTERAKKNPWSEISCEKFGSIINDVRPILIGHRRDIEKDLLDGQASFAASIDMLESINTITMRLDEESLDQVLTSVRLEYASQNLVFHTVYHLWYDDDDITNGNLDQLFDRIAAYEKIKTDLHHRQGGKIRDFIFYKTDRSLIKNEILAKAPIYSNKSDVRLYVELAILTNTGR
jgi:hypothetical protein